VAEDYSGYFSKKGDKSGSDFSGYFKPKATAKGPDLSAISPSGPGTPYPTAQGAPVGPRGIMSRVGAGIEQGFGESKVSPQDMQQHPVLGAAGKALELPGRAAGAVGGAVAGGISGLAEKAGMLPANADRLMRDLGIIGTGLAVEGGKGPAVEVPKAPKQIPKPAELGPAEAIQKTLGEPAAPKEVGEAVGEAVQQRVKQGQAEASQMFEHALGREGEFKPGAAAGFAEDIKSVVKSSQLPLHKKLTPASSTVLKLLDEIPGFKRAKTDPMQALTGAKEEKGPSLTLRDFEQARRIINSGYEQAAKNKTDLRTFNVIKEAFNTRLQDLVSSELFTGDPKTLDAIRAAVAKSAETKKLIGGKDAGAKMFQAIVQDKVSPEGIAKGLFGANKIGATEAPNFVWNRVIQALGPDHPAIGKIRSGMWEYARSRKNGVNELVNSAIGRKMYDPQTLNLMRQYAKQAPAKGASLNMEILGAMGRIGAAFAMKSMGMPHKALPILKPIMQKAIERTYGGTEE
jgi:hypothetical protein